MDKRAAKAEFLAEREYPEEGHSYRGPFERDRDRIVHCKAFRRLEYKTQVFVNHLGDNYRTRLTHSMEVAGISRSVGRRLGLNEDLIESIALAHDLGHPPFGHAGEKALHECMRGKGGFDHNEQSLRVVTILENRYPWFPGLNLTLATRLGLQKHARLPSGMSHTLEAQIVDLCDEIAYTNHDVDDGIESGFLSIDELAESSIWQEHWSPVDKEYSKLDRKIKVRYCIRNLINTMTSDLISSIRQNLAEFNIQNLDDVLSFHVKFPEARELAGFSASMAPRIKELKRLLFKKLYRHPAVNTMNNEARRVVSDIFHHLEKHPDDLPANYRERVEKSGLYPVLSDFVAGMTDRYALGFKG